MMKHLLSSLLLLLVLVACGGTVAEPALEENSNDDAIVAADTSNDSMAEEGEAYNNDANMDEHNNDDADMDEHNNEATMSEDEMAMSSEDETVMDSETAAEAMTERPDWHHISLTDVRNGESFTLADFAGKTVFVETMATWCTNYRRQLGNVAQAQAQLAGDENFVFVAISVETNIDDSKLATYTQNTGFDWPFAIATPDLLLALVEEYGRTITNPPSTPHFIIRPDGSTTELVTGFEGPETIITQLQAIHTG